MYIRWKKHTRKNKEVVVLSAFLVESKRINGKPRQQTLLSLGSIQENALVDPMSLAFFWRGLEQKMASAKLSESAVFMVRSRIATIVPLPERIPA